MQKQVLVSVFMLAYNHERFIRQAIESILMQEVDFVYEIVVGEDCSKDQTRSILLGYARNHPDKFSLQLHPRNVGAHKNQELTYYACKGKYIAMLEGDDYWTDTGKLQKQVDFLEANPSYNICYHNVRIVHEDGIVPPHLASESMREAHTIEDIARQNLIHTPSCMFRNGVVTEFPDWFQKSAVGDWPLFLMLAEKGKIKYLPDVMAVYRVHAGGTWSMRNRISQLEKWIKVVDYCNRHFGYRYKTAFYQQLIPCLWELVQLYGPEQKGQALRYGVRLLLLLRRHPQPGITAKAVRQRVFRPYYVRLQPFYAPLGKLLLRKHPRKNTHA